jgi:hypothetical protein
MQSTVVALTAAIATFDLAGGAMAQALEALQGAWAMDGTDCAATFRKDGDTIRFQDGDTSIKTGIIVNGNTIVGPSSTCTAEKVRQEDGRLVARLNCSDSVMAGGMSVAFKIIDATHFETFDHFFPDDPTSYTKCPM